MRFFYPAFVLFFWVSGATAQIDPRLLTAIGQNNPQALQTALRHGANPNATDSLGATPLMWACYKADTTVVKLLMKAGARTECRGVIRTDSSTYYGNLTGLAAGLNKLPLLRYLLETLKLPINEPEFNPQTGKNDGWTPAEWAAANGYLGVLKYLAEHGADLGVGQGNPMVLAASRNQTEIVAFLLERGVIPGKLHPDYASALNNLANLYSSMGQYEQALPLYRECLSIREKALGKRHPSYATSLNNLAELYRSMGQYEQALPLYRESLSIREKALGKLHPDYAISLNNLALLYQAMGQYEQALPLLLECLIIKEKALGKLHPSYATSLNNLAVFYMIIGQHEKALPLLLECLNIREKALGKLHPDYAQTLNNLAGLYESMGQYEKALPLFVECLSIREKAQGKLHPDYANTLSNLARLYESMGQNEKALPLYLECLSITEKALGKLHPSYASALNSLANLYSSIGQYEQALPLYLECLTIKEKALGKRHPSYATSLHNLAYLYKSMGQYEQALPLYRESLSITEKALGKLHPSYAQPLNNLAELYRSMGQYEQALPLYRESLSIREKALGKLHPDYAISLNNLALLYQAMSQYEKALPLYLECLTIKEKALGKLHPSYATSLNNLALLYSSMGQYEQALPLYLECMNIREKVLGKLHSDYANSLSNQAGLYQNMGQYEQALALYVECLTIQEKVLGKIHPDYANSLGGLALLYSSMGQYEKALPLYLECLDIQEKALGKLHPSYAETLNNLAYLYEKMGQYEKALPFYVDCRAIREQVLGKNHPDYANTLNNLAYWYENMGQYEKALPLLTAARQQYKSQLLQNIAVLNETALTPFQITFDYQDFTYSLGYTARAPALLGQHYNDALLSKGVGLMASQQLNRLLAQTTDTVAIRIGNQLLATKQSLNRQLTRPLPQQYGVDSLQRQANALEQTLLLRLPEYAQSFNALQVEWPQVQAGLKPNEAAIELVAFRYYHKRWTDSTYYAALVLRPGWAAPRFVILAEQKQLDTLLTTGAASPAEINTLYRGGVVHGTGTSTQLARGLALSRLIWQPLDSLLQGVKTVYISPAGRLHQVALAALPNLADTTQRMMDRFAIRQVGSTRVVALQTEQPTQPLSPSTVTAHLYGGIVYDTDSLGLVRQARQEAVEQRLALREATRSGSWDFLPGTQTEVDGLARVLPPARTTIHTGLAATEASLKALSGKAPRILHIATHGFFFPDLQLPKNDQRLLGLEGRSQFETAENPLLRSGLVLAGANYVWKGGKPIEGVDDGILTAYELSNLDLRGTELVVLSACETGLGQVKGSEGVYGLQRAVKMVGAKYLLMSLWRVSDKETAEYMQLLYGELLKTGSVVGAYDHARKQMRSRYPQEPFKWAAFVLVE